MSHSSWQEIKAPRADNPEAQAGYEQARRAYEIVVKCAASGRRRGSPSASSPTAPA